VGALPGLSNDVTTEGQSTTSAPQRRRDPQRKSAEKGKSRRWPMIGAWYAPSLWCY